MNEREPHSDEHLGFVEGEPVPTRDFTSQEEYEQVSWEQKQEEEAAAGRRSGIPTPERQAARQYDEDQELRQTQERRKRKS